MRLVGLGKHVTVHRVRIESYCLYALQLQVVLLLSYSSDSRVILDLLHAQGDWSLHSIGDSNPRTQSLWLLLTEAYRTADGHAC